MTLKFLQRRLGIDRGRRFATIRAGRESGDGG